MVKDIMERKAAVKERKISEKRFNNDTFKREIMNTYS